MDQQLRGWRRVIPVTGTAGARVLESRKGGRVREREVVLGRRLDLGSEQRGADRECILLGRGHRKEPGHCVLSLNHMDTKLQVTGYCGGAAAQPGGSRSCCRAPGPCRGWGWL